MARIAQDGLLDVKWSYKDQTEPKISFLEKQRKDKAVNSVNSEQARWQVGSNAPPILCLAAPTCEDEVRDLLQAGGSLGLRVLWDLYKLQLQKTL